MVKTQTRTKHGGLRKIGRGIIKCARYRAMKTREKNKIKKILQSNGIVAAKTYAENCELHVYLKELL